LLLDTVRIRIPNTDPYPGEPNTARVNVRFRTSTAQIIQIQLQEQAAFIQYEQKKTKNPRDENDHWLAVFKLVKSSRRKYWCLKRKIWKKIRKGKVNVTM
jgi:hypothetical protein